MPIRTYFFTLASFVTHMKMFSNCRLLKLSIRAILCLTAVIFLISYVLFSPGNNKTAPLEPIPSNISAVILFWNGFFEDTRWTLPEDTMLAQCPQVNCILTNQHDYLPSIVDYDAIVFHTARPFPYVNGRPLNRTANQWYIFSQLESPLHTKHNLKAERGFYNLTMSYRLDSDMVWSYNSILDISTNEVVAPALKPKWREVDVQWTQSDSDLMELIQKKKKFAAWFVSNCNVPSKRERLVKKLQAHINVDVYGKCGSLRCERSNSSCSEMLDTDYKFYFSFENSLCIDYVTEKFFNAMQRYIVPVVYGGANYTRFAPPHSYIDVQDFQNVSALAAHLQYLDENPLEYAKYFWWRRDYTIAAHQSAPQTLPYCNICQRISSYPAIKRTQIYIDINGYWNHGTCNIVSRIKF